MFIDIFCNEISKIISHINTSDLTEVRLRVGKPIILFYGKNPYFLSDSGLTTSISNSISINKQQLEDIVFRASNCAIYSVNEKLKRGFIVLADGTRLGICGDMIIENGEVTTITNFSSINIRVAHQIKNCSLDIYHHIVNKDDIKNTLIISPPGAGKTTLLRDLVYQISNHIVTNITILDERGEIAGDGMDIGNCADVISFSSKELGFEQAIRTMSPALIATDELGNKRDADALVNAFNCGVKIFATIHGNSLEDLKRKDFMKDILSNFYFERYVILSAKEKPGTIDGVYNQKFNRIGYIGEI